MSEKLTLSQKIAKTALGVIYTAVLAGATMGVIDKCRTERAEIAQDEREGVSYAGNLERALQRGLKEGDIVRFVRRGFKVERDILMYKGNNNFSTVCGDKKIGYDELRREGYEVENFFTKEIRN